MHPILRKVLAVITGVFAGGIINFLLIKASSKIIPPPPGTDFTTEAGLKASMHLMEPKHFIFPFLAHALHALIGSMVACKLSGNNHIRIAMIVGFIVFLGGAMEVMSLPSPLWFNILDLAVAYFPMAYLGAKIVSK
jgi:hypothetical protein